MGKYLDPILIEEIHFHQEDNFLVTNPYVYYKKPINYFNGFFLYFKPSR